jgi:hypothetical protein
VPGNNVPHKIERWQVYTGWSQIWKKNPNLENIFENPLGGRADFAVWNCQIARRRGEIEVGR